MKCSQRQYLLDQVPSDLIDENEWYLAIDLVQTMNCLLSERCRSSHRSMFAQ